jgi:hypothetical protein
VVGLPWSAFVLRFLVVEMAAVRLSVAFKDVPFSFNWLKNRNGWVTWVTIKHPQYEMNMPPPCLFYSFFGV